MVQFKDYFSEDVLLEVAATDKNIDKFADIYRVRMDDEEMYATFDDFNTQVKRGTLKKIDPPAHAKDPHDIFSYHSWDDLDSALRRSAELKTKGELKRIEKEGATRVFENDRAIIIHPKTHEASCHYGAGSKWCTAARDPENFREYTNGQGVVLLYVLPKGESFDVIHEFKVRETQTSDTTVDHAIYHYPDAFDWSYDSETKSIGKYIKAAYLRNEPSEPLSTIAGWKPYNASGIAQTREYMRRVILNWNLNGTEIMMDVLGDGWEPDQEEIQDQADLLMQMAKEQGMIGFLETAWGNVPPGSPGAEHPIEDNWTNVQKVMTKLHQGGQAIGRAHPIKSRKNEKLALAVYATRLEEGGWLDAGEQADEMEQVTGLSHAFGDYAAEGYDAEDSKIGVNKIVKAAGLTNEDIKKINEYITMFAGEKVWRDKVPKKVYEYMENPANQTPENIKKADEFFIQRPFWQSTWEYAWRIRGKLSRTAQDDYVDVLDDRKKHMVAVPSKPWVELEKAFIHKIDEAAKEGNKVRDYMFKKQEWTGVQELEKEFDMDAGGAVDHVNQMYDDWRTNHQQPAANYLSNAVGLLGYLFHVKKYNWPELEKRISDPKYYHIRVHKLGPDWIQHGRGGERWKEFEDMLEEKWMYISAHPFINQKDVETATTNFRKTIPRWEIEQAKTNIHNHNNLHGDVENMIDIVKATKRAYGGGTGGSERAAWEEAKDAWWNDPDTVALYWGHGAIVKKPRPSEKRRGKGATKYFVTDNRVPRPFYHEVKPGAWLAGIPNIFTLSTAHSTPQYIGAYHKGFPDPVPEMSVGNLIDRHEGRRRGA